MTNLPHPGRDDLDEIPFPAADLAEVLRLYALRNWVEQSYRQVKQELGWADFMVRTDRAIRRHWELVCCAFTFCWHHWFDPPIDPPSGPAMIGPFLDNAPSAARDASLTASTGRGENGGRAPRRAHGRGHEAQAILAPGAPARPRLAPALDRAPAVLAGVVHSASAPGTPGPSQLGRRWPSH